MNPPATRARSSASFARSRATAAVPRHVISAVALLALAAAAASAPGCALLRSKHAAYEGEASYYGKAFHGRKTASGEVLTRDL